jgi:apolipoprotein N-acyltransferase
LDAPTRFKFPQYIHRKLQEDLTKCLAQRRAQRLIKLMPQLPEAPSITPIPLVVDLDGTLIRTDLLWESLARLLRRNPFSIFQILFWWTRGRAFLKEKLAARVKIAPTTLPYNDKFLAWLREQKSTGRKIILATASDLQMAKPVADYVGIFGEVLASDGRTNLRSGNKLKLLTEKFGEHGFDYAGNSPPDLTVWRGAREAIVVNASVSLVNHAGQIAKVGATFLEGYSPLFIAKSVLNELFIRSGYLLAIAAGLLLTLAFPKFDIAGFAWIAPGLLAFAAFGKNPGDAFRVGFIGGMVYWLTSLYWLLLMPVTGFPILGWIALSAVLALFMGTWTWLAQVRSPGFSVKGSWSARLTWSLCGAAIWVALEMMRARVLGGFPWNFIGASQYKMVPLIQIASVAGVYGVSFLVVWVSLSLFSAAQLIFYKPAARLSWQSEIILPFIVVVAVFIFGEIKLERGLVVDEAFRMGKLPERRVTLVQPSIPQTMIWDEKESESRFRKLLELSEYALAEAAGKLPGATNSVAETNSVTRDARSSDLLIWPESAVPGFSDVNYAAITNIVRIHHVGLIFNADDVVPHPNATNGLDNDYFNSAFLFSPERNFAGVYHKQRLVMFGEYIPFTRWLPFMKWFTPITDGYQAGTAPAQFETYQWSDRLREPVIELDADSSSPQTIRVSPLICYEDMFPQLARMSASWHDNDFLVNLTNDGWFGNSAEQWQHMASAVFRAVENGIPLVRCANNGVTCWIDGNGRVREIFRDANGSVYGEGAITIDLPLPSHEPTFYNRYGDWFGWGCVAISLIVLGFKIARRKSVR